jgi:nicotinate phosphoribosyltransferase
VRHGEPVDGPGLEPARERVKEALLSLPWDGLKLSRGEPAIPTRMISAASH